MAPEACDECLRRTWLVGALAPYIERLNEDAPGSRCPELLALSDEDLVEVAARGRAGEVLDRANAGAGEARSKMAAAELWACCRHDDRYPVSLSALGAEAPAALLGRGDPGGLARLGRETAVTIVGSRRASAYGREVAGELGRDLAGAGLAVVSGMARGVDSGAHEGALEARGFTVAVLGCGADRPYPAGKRALYRRIVESGLVLSELPPGARPWRWTFPARNRVMAAISGMTVVVEAAEHSGSLITSGMALDVDREVGAVPGSVTSWLSAGTNRLLAEGAKVVRDAQDVLDALLGPGQRVARRAGPALADELLPLLDAVERGFLTCDAVAGETGARAGDVAAGLARLELHGYVRCDPAGRYTRTLLDSP